MPILGAHMPTAGGLGKAIRNGKKIGCDAVQVFTSSPQQWYAKEITDTMVADFRAALSETGIQHVISHDSYLINLASPTDDNREKSVAALTDELRRSGKYGIKFVVSHIASRKGQGDGETFLLAAEGMRRVLGESPPEVTLLMETTAGMGSSINTRFEEIAAMFELLGEAPRVGVCLDTCHIFAAGYDIRAAEAYEATFKEFDRLVGLDRLQWIHLNDSKKGLGSHVDRHADIGEGEIGLEGFRLLVNDPRMAAIPMALETPDADVGHPRNLATLRSLIEP